MKRILIVTIAILIMLNLFACGKKEEVQEVSNPEPTAVQEVKEVEPTPEPVVEEAKQEVTVNHDTDIVSEAVFALPNADFDVVGTAVKGDKLELVEAGVEWHKVMFNDSEAFVLAVHVDGVDPLPSPYYIYIEKGSHTINVYSQDDNGEYTILEECFLTATGKTAGKTPTGVFALSKKYEWKQFDSAGTDQPYSYSPYVSQFTDGIYMHGPVFAEQDFTTMYGNTYKEIGTNSTAGCLRTNVGSAYWIYMNCPLGTTVEVVNASPRGIETPDLIRAIHDIPKGKYFDPTDPNYVEEEE